MLFPFFAALIATAWLVPNHYAPWVAAWGDGVAIAGLLALAMGTAAQAVRPGRLSAPIVIAATACGAAFALQALASRIVFIGDVVLAAWYVELWVIAVLTGHMLSSQPSCRPVLTALMCAWVLCAVLSVGVALMQWSGALGLGIYAVDLPPGGRPFGNVAQPNHLSTLCFWSLCALAWLHQIRKVNGAVFWTGAVFLMVGMVISQSRTAWLQMVVLLIWLLAMGRRVPLRLSRLQVLAPGAIFTALSFAWPHLSDALLLSPGRTTDEVLQPGTRRLHWEAMIDAIGREPWLGYGWQQVGAAQQRVALDHVAPGESIDHAHNLLLDLALWNGVPLAAVVLVALITWFVIRVRTMREPAPVWLMAAVIGVFAHAMVEYPLSYAYFLIPVGLAMGAIDGVATARLSIPVAPKLAAVVVGLAALLFACIATDYLRAEEGVRALRMEAARIGVAGIVTPVPRLRVLDQLEAYLQFAHTEAKPGMTPAELRAMERVVERYGDQAVMLRYAMAAGLNGQPHIAERTLARLCRIHPKPLCVQAQQTWRKIVEEYPVLKSVALPAVP